MTNNLIKSFLGIISRNDFLVFEISCILASPQNFKVRTKLILQKLKLHLSDECVLVLLPPVATRCLYIISCYVVYV